MRRRRPDSLVSFKETASVAKAFNRDSKRTLIMNIKKILFSVPVPSTDFTTEAYLDGSGIEPAIRFGYENDGEQYLTGICFSQVSAFRKRGERCCSAWHIEGAYDTLVEIEDSSWVAELQKDVPEQYRENWKPHHFMIYLDSVGCFEFLAQSWAALPNEVIPSPA